MKAGAPGIAPTYFGTSGTSAKVLGAIVTICAVASIATGEHVVGSGAIAVSGAVVTDSSVSARSVGASVRKPIKVDDESLSIEDEHGVFKISVPNVRLEILKPDDKEFSEVIHIKPDMSNPLIIGGVEAGNGIPLVGGIKTLITSIGHQIEPNLSPRRENRSRHLHTGRNAGIVNVWEQQSLADDGNIISASSVGEITQLVSIASSFEHEDDSEWRGFIKYDSRHAHLVGNKLARRVVRVGGEIVGDIVDDIGD